MLILRNKLFGFVLQKSCNFHTYFKQYNFYHMHTRATRFMLQKSSRYYDFRLNYKFNNYDFK